MAPAAKCGVCSKNVTKSDAGVECGVCRTWCHISCVNIPVDLYNLLGKNNCIIFNCQRCLDNSTSSSDNMTLKQCLAEFDQKLSDKLNTFTAEMHREQETLRTLIETSITDIRHDLTSSLESIKRELESCTVDIKSVEARTMAKAKSLELEDNKLRRIINRADVVVTGLPTGINCLLDPVMAICEHYKIDAVPKDINHCLYIQGGRSILVKFNTVRLRDALMKEYFKAPNLQLKDVINADVAARVYLSDNLTPAALQLQILCRALRKSKKISWFRLINNDVPMAKIKFSDGTEKTFDFAQCSELRNG